MCQQTSFERGFVSDVILLVNNYFIFITFITTIIYAIVHCTHDIVMMMVVVVMIQISNNLKSIKLSEKLSYMFERRQIE